MTQQFADDTQRYRLESRIATGGMGEVWRATDTMLGREVAVKLLKVEFTDDPTFRSRFEVEARHAAALHHPGVAAVFDVGEAAPTDGSGHPRPFLVMELVNGQPLATLLQDARNEGRQLDPDVVRDLMAQTGDALGAAHRAGIVHRDVKPANLMVTPQGVVKVTDFGIARAADGVGITRTGAVMGTPQYLSPEQAEGRAATSASDVYALGVVAFECLAGRRPFEAESPVATALAHIREPVPDLPARVPADLAAVVHRALSKDPAARYPDGAAFAAALRNPAAGGAAVVPATAATQVLGPIAPEPVTTSTTVTSGPVDPATERRSPWPIVLVVLLLVALAVVVTLLATRGSGGDPTPVSSTSPSRTRTPSSSSAPTTSSTSAGTVFLDEGAYVGQPYQQVEADLRAKGLKITENRQPNSDPANDGIVTGINPSQDVPTGSTITVSFYDQAPATSSPPPPSSSSPPVTSSPPTSTTSAPSPTLPTSPGVTPS